eukprot:363385-Chlamydomonas_euryale.AAC.4
MSASSALRKSNSPPPPHAVWDGGCTLAVASASASVLGSTMVTRPAGASAPPHEGVSHREWCCRTACSAAALSPPRLPLLRAACMRAWKHAMMSAWCAMSVASTMSMTRRRSSVRSPPGRWPSTSLSAARSSASEHATWWFSIGDWSL